MAALARRDIRTLLLAASALVPALLATAARAQTPITPPANMSSSWAYGAGPTARTLHARAADIYNVRDYGALGTNTGTTLAQQFPAATLTSLNTFATQWVSGVQAYAWMTNPAFGLTFSMPTSTDQGGTSSTLTFAEQLTGINNWSATVAAWQDPTHGNYLLQPGMQVSGACIATETTVTAMGRTPNASGYATVTLSKPLSSDCTAGSSITFTIAPAQLAALTMDWLGVQSAMAAAWLNTSAGGSVYIPAGNYILNHSLVNAGGITDTGSEVPNLDIHGDGYAMTRLQWPNDLGQDTCAILSGGRGSPESSNSTYHGLRLIGPGYSRVNGTAPNNMDGLCLGESDKAYMIRISAMRAGINGIKDHWSLRDAVLTNNGYGIYFAPYSSTIGNQLIEDTNLAGNMIASIGVATTDQIDASLIKNVHTGFSPYGIYYEANTKNVSQELYTVLSNSVLMNVYIEAVGNGWIYGSGESGAVVNNTFIGGGGSDVGSQPAYAITNASGGVVAAPAVIYVNEFQNNTMISTFWSAYGSVKDDIVEAGDYAVGNSWINDTGFVFNATSTVSPIKGGNNTSQNRFETFKGDGVFRSSGSSVGAGVPVYDNGYLLVFPYKDGRPFSGITASPAGAGHTVAVLTYSDLLYNVAKADPSQAIAAGQPVFVTTGGLAGGLTQEGSIGESVGTSAAGSTTVNIDLDPGTKGGATGTALGLAASGGNQSNAMAITSLVNQFSYVNPGTGTILGVVPIGQSEVVCNDGANSLLVYPQAGGEIGSAGTNIAVSVAPGTSATFMRMSATVWHR
ncbi:hypothetical protein [Lichenicoccus sp.]|uniref:hypothetical protein n=1 Tax=Lichenicoccus sp. TaxID=2781899 RepID=UPI003D0A9E4E